MGIFKSFFLMMFLSVCVFVLSAGGQLYRWTDENGVVHFSDRPMGKTELLEVIETPETGSSDSDAPGSNAIYDPAPEGPTNVELLDSLNFDGSKESLRNIQEVLLPAAKVEGNGVALSVCRQTCYALGQDIALRRKDGLHKNLAKSIHAKKSADWFSKVQQKAMAGDPFFQTTLAIWYLEGSVLSGSRYNPIIAALNKDAGKGLSLLRQASSAGYWDATNKLGQIYQVGNFVTQDDHKAFSLYMKAFEQGSISAAYNLGISYSTGKGVARDMRWAMYYWEKAAKQGDALAQFNLGLTLCQGNGVSRNISRGKPWLIKSARQKNWRAVDYCHNILGVNMGELYTEMKNSDYITKNRTK